MFDECLNPPPCVDPHVSKIITPGPAISTGTPSSTTIDQYAPSLRTSQTTQETPPLVIPLDVEEADHDIEVADMDNNPYAYFSNPEPSFKESSTRVVIPNNVHSTNQPPEHINKWTKDDPIDNEEGIDFEESFSLIARLEDIRIFIAFAAHINMVVYQMDKKIMFLNGILCEVDSCIDLTTFTDVDHAGCQGTRKSTSESMQLLGDRLSESYHMFIKYSTGQIPPKQSRDNGLQGKKTVDDSLETVDVSKESEPEPFKKKTASKRVVKKKVKTSADDNIILDPDVDLEVGKSISLAEAKEEEATKQVHVTHARIVTKSVPESTNKETATLKPKLKGVQSLTSAEKEAADFMKALKESKKTNKRKPGTGGSSEENYTIPGVCDESTVISATSNEGTDTKPGVLDEEKVITKENVILEWGSKQKSAYLEEDQLDDQEKDDKEESGEDDIYKYKIRVRKYKDEEMTNAEVEESRNDDEKETDTDKAYAKKIEEAKDDSKRAELPPTSSSLSISLVQETSSAAPITTLPLLSVSTTPHVPQQTTTPIPTPPIITETLNIITTVPKSETLTVVQLRVAKLEKDVSELGDALQKALQKHSIDLIQKHFVKPAPESSKIQSPTVNLKQGSEKSALGILKINRNPANQKLHHALMKALIEDENVVDKGVVDTVKDHKKHDDDDDDDDDDPYDDEDPQLDQTRVKLHQKALKLVSLLLQRNLLKNPIAEVVKDDVGEDLVRDNDQPQDTPKPRTTTTPNPKWFTQPPRPPTPDSK
uniref:Retrovirus-related Pol polyprotein from transposon TNT 1-94 n=1 Tax=Tanacetum cinerariifolium TaxID=118510 RepID=A0A6L2JQB0_TANCI|nr:retrovirus-related Pol polyprotein from transposon TNT 1-94 [Tanacetum cinerariifolium]